MCDETRPDSGFGDRLRRDRVAAGLTQEELAERSGLSVRAISDLERGRVRRPRYGTAQRLAGALLAPGQDYRRAAERPWPQVAQLPGDLADFTGRLKEASFLTGLLAAGIGRPGAVVTVAVTGGSPRNPT